MHSKFRGNTIYSLPTIAAVLLMTLSLSAQTPNTASVKWTETPARTSAARSDKQSVEAISRKHEKTATAETPEHPVRVEPSSSPNENRKSVFTPASIATTSVAKPAAQTTSDESEWRFAFTPYLFASALSGTVGARGRTLEIDASFGDVFENLDIGLMGTFEARKGRLVTLTDLIWTKMSVERDTPGGLFSDAKVGVNLFIFDPEVGYRVIDNEAGSLDVLGGVRIWSVETNLNLNTGILPGFDVSERKTFAAPVVGAHGLLNLTPKFYLTGKFDIGGGIGADFTSQLYGGAGFRITPQIALIGGYRYLQADYDDDEGFIYDTKMHGLVFGARFSF